MDFIITVYLTLNNECSVVKILSCRRKYFSGLCHMKLSYSYSVMFVIPFNVLRENL